MAPSRAAAGRAAAAISRGRRVTATVRRRVTGLRLDPSRTALLRRALATALASRLERFRTVLRHTVVTQDAFGLAPRPSGGITLHAGRYAFLSSAEKLKAFEDWARGELDSTVLQGAGSVLEKYIRQGYARGAGRAVDDYLKAAGKGTPAAELRAAFGNPLGEERLKVLASRAFTDLKGVTDAMATQMVRVLADGLTRGLSPRDVGKELDKVVTGLGRNRANTIARTEIIRAHAEGQLDALEQMGVEEVGVQVEWTIANDACPLCAAMAGKVMPIAKARGLIPLHPNCRCVWVPVVQGKAAAKRAPRQRKAAAARSAAKVASTPAPTTPQEPAVPPAPGLIDPSLPIGQRVAQYQRGDALVQLMASVRDEEERLRQAQQAAARAYEDHVARWGSVRTDLNPKQMKERVRLAKDMEDSELALHNAIRQRAARAHALLFKHLDTGGKVELRPTAWRGPIWQPQTGRAVEFGDKSKQEIADGAAFLSKVVGQGTIVPPINAYPIGMSENERSHYHPALRYIRLTGFADRGTVIHELGHHMENTLPGAQKAANDFLTHRVGNEPIVKLQNVFPSHNFGPQELGRKDDFEKLFGAGSSNAYYAGKSYPGQRDTEIISMGVEQLYRDPVGFAQKDPEYFKFICGILDGSLRRH